jgi:hypothetical protein
VRTAQKYTRQVHPNSLLEQRSTGLSIELLISLKEKKYVLPTAYIEAIGIGLPVKQLAITAVRPAMLSA